MSNVIWYFVLLVALLLGSLGQILFRFGTAQDMTFMQLLFSPTIIFGLTIYFLSALMYIAVLKHVPLSIAYPTISLSYVIIIFASHYIFAETITIQKIIATILIVAGVVVLYIK